MLLNEDINSMRQYYPHIDPYDFQHYIELDPTYRPGSSQPGRYARWILQLANSNKISRIAHLPDLLRRFEESRNDLINKDIMSYRTMAELEDALNDESSYKAKSKRQELRDTQRRVRSADLSEQATLIFDSPEWEIWRPDTYEASCKLGRGTQWCTASTESPYYFNMYTKQDPLYIFINKKNDREKYQLHIPTGSFMDQEDQEAAIVSLVELNPELDTPVVDLYKDYWGIEESFSSLFEELTITLDQEDIEAALEYQPLTKSEVAGPVVSELLFTPKLFVMDASEDWDIQSRFWFDWETHTIRDELSDSNRQLLGSLIGKLDRESLENAPDVQDVLYDAFHRALIEGTAAEWHDAAVGEVDNALDIAFDSNTASGEYDEDDREVHVHCTFADLLEYIQYHMTRSDFARTDSIPQDVVYDILQQFTELYKYKIDVTLVDWELFNDLLDEGLTALRGNARV